MPPNREAANRAAKAYRAMKKLGYESKVVKPVLHGLLKVYEKDWVHIEQDNYQVLVDAILDTEEQKAEEFEPSPKNSNMEKNQPHGMQMLPKPTRQCVSKNSHFKGQSSSSPLAPIMEEADEINFVTDKRVKTYGGRNGRKKRKLQLLDEDDDLEEMEIDKHLHEAALECSTPPVPKDVYFIEYMSDLDKNKSEPMHYEQSEAAKNKGNAQGYKLDVASSSGGEVKIFLSSPKSDDNVPTLETVLKKVEEQCLKSYKIPQTGFSVLKLMKEVCECFLSAGTNKTHFVDVRPTDMVSSLEISEDTYLNNPPRIQNHFEVLPQIPRFVGLTELDLSCCTIYVNVDPKRIGGMETMEINYSVPSSSRMMIVQKCYYHYITDISKGQEAYEVSLINEVNEEQAPAFNYIPRNMTYHNAYSRFLLSQISEENCCSFGDCLSLEIPCACAGKVGDKFAYTTGGLLKENFLDNVISKSYSALQQNLFYCQDCPVERCKGNILSCKCKGHVERNFIRECWHKCGCSSACGNRVVQRGITTKLQVFRTPGQKGWGLRTLEEIPKGAFICEYVGEVITCRESFERNLHNTVLLEAGWSSKGVLKEEQSLCLDATIYGNVARFINHRCFDANLVEIPVEVETRDHNYYHLALFATRKIDAFEELTWDYGTDFYHPVKAFQCVCGSNFCRDRKSLKR